MAPQAAQLLDHRLDRSGADLVAVEGGDRAELAAVWAAAGGLEHVRRQVPSTLQHLARRNREVGKVYQPALVERLEAAGAKVLDHARDVVLGLADTHGVAILAGFLRHEGWVETAE